MSEITKLYENAGAKPTYTDECQMADSYYSMAKDLNERGILFDDYMEQECPNKNKVCYETCPYAYNKEFYPPFTAEKQIELIKKLGNINIDIDNGCYMSSEILEVEAHCDTFEETLAEFVNNLWQDLTPGEKQQVKGILE